MTIGRWSLLVAASTTVQEEMEMPELENVKSRTDRDCERTKVATLAFKHVKFLTLAQSHSRFPDESVRKPHDT